MRVNKLRRYTQADQSNYLIHFTGRKGNYPILPATIAAMSSFQRLANIVINGELLAFPPFGNSEPCVCFSECIMKTVEQLVGSRYEPYGIAFTKQFAFEHRASPAFYVRGDEWEHVLNLPTDLRGRATRFWPGAVADEGETLALHLAGPSEWLFEREWRIVDDGLRFGWSDIAFLIVPDQLDLIHVADDIEEHEGGAERKRFEEIPFVEMDASGKVISDPCKLWQAAD